LFGFQISSPILQMKDSSKMRISSSVWFFLRKTSVLRYYGVQCLQFCVAFCITVKKNRFKING